MATAPNIILLVADQWRGDWTGTGGHSMVRTPNHGR